MTTLTPTPKQQIFGTDGTPLVGGKIYTYSAGTTTPLATYTDAGGLTANTNPIILNSLGQADIWLALSSSYKFSVYTSANVLLYTVDSITAPLDYLTLTTSFASPPPIGSTTPNTGAFTTLSTTGVLTVGGAANVTGKVTSQVGYQFSDGSLQTSAAPPQIITLAATVAASALTITQAQLTFAFRPTTLNSGAITTVTGTPANLVVPSTATLGTVSAVQSRLIVLALNNAGIIELAVVNIAGGTNLTETGLINTTAIAVASNSASTVYSTTARTSVAYRVIGYIESTQATAGTWVTSPSTLQGVGGQALTAMSSFGYGQTLQDVTGSRTLGTIYYNTTGKMIKVTVNASNSTSNNNTILTVAGTIDGRGAQIGAGLNSDAIAFVQPGESYVLTSTGTPTILSWIERR